MSDTRPARAPRRCLRNGFSEELLQQYSLHFAPFPIAWASHPNGVLSRLWKEGGVGAVSVFPLLVYIAQRTDNWWAMSREELAHLSGCSGASIDRAREVFTRLGVAQSKVEKRYGVNCLHWKPTPSLKVKRGADGRFIGDHFYFPLSLIYGGTWAAMSAPERAAYLVVASQARQFDPETVSGIFTVRDLTEFGDLGESFRYSKAQWDAPTARLAMDLTQSAIAHYTGLSPRAVVSAVSRWHCDGLPRAESYDDHRPVWVIPTPFGSAIYFIRDHVTPHLNQERAFVCGDARCLANA